MVKCEKCGKKMERLEFGYATDAEYKTWKWNVHTIDVRFVCHNCKTFTEQEYKKQQTENGNKGTKGECD